MAIVLRKRGNAAMDADRPTLRAFGCVAALDKDQAIACARHLTAKHHRSAEPDNIYLLGH